MIGLLGCVRVHARLRSFREGKGWSLDRLSAESGVAKGTIDKYENEGIRWKGDLMRKLAEALGVDYGTLVDESTPVPPWAKEPTPKRSASRRKNGERGPEGHPKNASSGDTGGEPTGLTGSHSSTNIDEPLSTLGPKVRLNAYLGGSARPFTMSSDRVEFIEAPLALGDGYLLVMVADGTLEFRPGTVLVFERTAATFEDSPLLVGRKEGDEHAIRHFDPQGEEGTGTFVDRKGVLQPLSPGEWEVRGVLALIAAKNGRLAM